jgi:hypothetical protein
VQEEGEQSHTFVGKLLVEARHFALDAVLDDRRDARVGLPQLGQIGASSVPCASSP